jgi:hypothetical protein
MGDLVGGDRRSRLLLNAVMRLEREAQEAGGRIHALLGNHDVLPARGRFGKMTRKERELYTRHTIPDAVGSELDDAFRGNSVYAQWLRRRPTLLKIGDTVFVHAGLGRWALRVDPAALNAYVRAWVAHFQGVGPRPPRRTEWTIAPDGGGPLWTRAFKPRRRGRAKGAPSRKMLAAILERLGADCVVVGHSPTRDGEILLDHPHYGDAVALIDTRISDERRGRLGALVIEDGVHMSTYAESRDDGRFLDELEGSALAEKRSLVKEGLFRRVVRFVRRLLGHE